MNNKITHPIKFSPEFNQMIYTTRNLKFFRKRFGIDTLNDFIDFSIIYTIKNLRPEVIEFYNNDIPLNIEELDTYDEREYHFIENNETVLWDSECFETYHDTWHYLDARKKGNVKYAECSDVEKEMINDLFKSK